VNERIDYNYIDYGCGFPVVIDKVLVRVETWGEVPRIDYDLLQQKVLEALAVKKTRLTGHEVRFIRLYFRLTLEAFAAMLKVSHPAVSKWENREDNITNMNPATEIVLRLFVQQKIASSDSDFLRTFQFLIEHLADGEDQGGACSPITVTDVSPDRALRRARAVAG
jgi:DNA-binding transcriptional regulator YiaG